MSELWWPLTDRHRIYSIRPRDAPITRAAHTPCAYAQSERRRSKRLATGTALIAGYTTNKPECYLPASPAEQGVANETLGRH